MKTDRTLLELAAKAAGYAVTPHSNYKIMRDFCFVFQGRNWNPLTDDGDALRLAVKLNLCFGGNFDGDMAVAFGREGRDITEPFGADKYAATRRAIVRAAAAIGEAM